MSLNKQGVTFGFFETLPNDTRNHVENILYGSQGEKVMVELPWKPDSQSVEEPATPVTVSLDEPPTEVLANAVSSNEPAASETAANKEAVVTQAAHIEPAVIELTQGERGTVGTSDVVPLQSPPGLQQPMYHHVVAGIQPHPHMFTYMPMGVYPQPVPISYMPVIPPPGAPMMMPPQQDLGHMAMSSMSNKGVIVSASRDSDSPPENNNQVDYEKEKILGGKTYERRNKKKRPADYYQKIGTNAPPTSSGMSYGTMVPDLQNNVYSVGQSGIGQPPHMHPHITQVQGMPLQYQPHQSSPMPPEGFGGNVHPPAPVAGQEGVPVALASPAGSHYAPAMGHVPITSQFIPPGASVQSPPLPQPVDIVQIPQNNPTVEYQNKSQSSHAPSSILDENSGHSHQQDQSLSSELYTDGSRTDNATITFGEVHDELRSLVDQKNVLPWDQKDKIDTTGPEAKSVTQECSSNNQQSIEVTRDKGHNTLQEDCASATTQPEKEPSTGPSSDSKEPSPVLVGAKPVVHTDTSVTGASCNIPDVVESQQTVNTEFSGAQSGEEELAKSTASEVPNQDTTNVQNWADSVPDDDRVPVPLPKPKATSWAGLFRGTSTAESATVIYNDVSQPVLSVEERPVAKKEVDILPETVPVDEDKAVQQLGTLLKEYTLSYKPVGLQPRGLLNRGNWCYVNATLQALMACPPLYNLLQHLPFYPAVVRGPSSTPITDSMVEFANEFSPMPQMKPAEKNNKLGPKGNIKLDVPTGTVFEPSYVYKMLQVIKYDGFKHGRQEDAEEFLSCVLNGLHDEMVAAIKAVDNGSKPNHTNAKTNEVTANGEAEINEDDDISLDGDSGWEQVGPKNKSVITRVANFESSPVSRIFRGQIRNILNRSGTKESATLQPFFTLQLDIQSENIYTVQDALENMVSREALQGFTCSRTKMEVDASRRTMLEELPSVLVLHLKCFIYDKNGGCQKVTKQVDFSNELEISKDLMSPTVRAKYPLPQRKYKLLAVVKHIGVRAAGGHYTTDIFSQPLGEWLHFDDNHVHTATMTQVFKFHPSKVPYLLYYRRTDLS